MFGRLGQRWLCDLALCSTHCGSWMLAPCQTKQNLIPSAGKARPPLSNPMLSSLVVWSAHTALPPCVSPLGRKTMPLVRVSHPALFMGLYNTQTTKKKKKVTWSQSSQLLTGLQSVQWPSLHVFIPSWRLCYLRQRFSATLPQCVNIKAAAFYLWSSAPVPNYP